MKLGTSNQALHFYTVSTNIEANFFPGCLVVPTISIIYFYGNNIVSLNGEVLTHLMQFAVKCKLLCMPCVKDKNQLV